MSKALYFAFLKKPANQTGDYYKPLQDSWVWLYEWHDDGTVWRCLQNNEGLTHISEGTFLAPEPLEWNAEEFEDKWYPRGSSNG